MLGLAKLKDDNCLICGEYGNDEDWIIDVSRDIKGKIEMRWVHLKCLKGI